MASFLTLPLELRLVIIQLVVYNEENAPFERPLQTDRVPVKERQHYRGWGDGRTTLCTPNPSHYVPKASNLLRTNRQLKSETESLLRKSQSLVYKLDLAIMQGYELWPTWTSIPSKARIVDEVCVKIRVAGPGPLCFRALQPGNAAPPHIVWWFYNMLERFLVEGPSNPDSATQAASQDLAPRATLRQKIAAHALDLDFIDGSVYPSSGVEETMGHSFNGSESDTVTLRRCIHCRRGCRREFGRRDLSPETLFIFLVDEIFCLLIQTSMFRWGVILYHGIGVLRFRLRGKIKAEIDLAQLLANMPIDIVHNTERWIRSINAVRMPFGLRRMERTPAKDYAEWLKSVPWSWKSRELLQNQNL